MDLHEKLFSLADSAYRDFYSALMPGIDKSRIIGIRIPILRKFSKEFAKTEQVTDFLAQLPHKYYEENNLHGMLIGQTNDYTLALKRLDEFLPHIDNWATCDMLSFRVFRQNTDKLFLKAEEWISSTHTYTVRYGVNVFMDFYLDSEYRKEFPDLISKIKSEEYYVKMGIAWYFATALAKQYKSILPYFTNHILDEWTHNKALQKAIESYSITETQKAELRDLKIKK